MSKQEFHIKVGTTTRVYGWLEFEEPTLMFEGNKIFNSTIGAYSNVANNTEIRNTVIGRYCSIASNCFINPGQHPADRLTSSVVPYSTLYDWYLPHTKSIETFADTYRPVNIGHDVWIGAGVVLMGGITIGNGSIIGAGSVVTKDVEPYAIVGGVPSKVIRRRFSEDISNKIEELRWWDFDVLRWQCLGTFPGTAVSTDTLAELESAILSGKVPKIEHRKCKVTFEGSTSRIERLSDNA